MSHVDDGILHAYLDGELSALEAARLEAHLADCAPCRARLDEQRDVVARASWILALAEPPERAAPPLHQLRNRRLAWRTRMPLTWAALLVIAVAASWFAFGMQQRSALPEADRPLAFTPPASARNETDARGPTSESTMRSAEQKDALGRAGAPTAGARVTPHAPQLAADSTAVVAVEEQRLARRAREESTLALGRDSQPIAALNQAAERRDAAPPAAQPSAAAAGVAPIRTDALGLDYARTLLSGEVHAIEDIPVDAIRARAGPPALVVVDQRLPSGVLVSLRQQPAELGKATVSTRAGPQQIVGRVKDAVSGAPIANAQVAVHGTPFSATAAQSGAFVIDSVAQGTYSLEARNIGYDPVVLYGARVDSGRTTAVEFSLQSSAGALDEVIVSGAEEQRARRQEATPRSLALTGAAVSGGGLVRRIGQLRVEISGPLPPDSLRKLLEKVRPIR
jgi:hypothetical protein